MTFRCGATLLLLFTITGSANAFEKDSSGRAGAVIAMADSSSPDTDSLGGAGVHVLRPLPAATPDTLASCNLKTAPVSHGETQKLQLIKRKYNSGQQVLLATGMMIFVVGIMTMAQQWNPR
ncbi:MAG: hypothetical protein JW768_08440 [Chitinispirillaceae bacterium]|nr:hypothetical protein [Chitinispirillaceae bacterium]